jgi:tRNA-dihydrouridine synthase B
MGQQNRVELVNGLFGKRYHKQGIDIGISMPRCIGNGFNCSQCIVVCNAIACQHAKVPVCFYVPLFDYFCPKIILFLCPDTQYKPINTTQMQAHEIHFAPMQGYTDKTYRMVHTQFWGGIDFYYTPYLSVENDFGVKRSALLDLPDNVTEPFTVPQLLPANVSELRALFKHMGNKGYRKVNLNLGCPYPMVTRKGRGAGLLQAPEIVAEMINLVNDEFDIPLSIKTRSGMVSHNELFPFLEKIPLHKLESVIVHPRVAAQLYKGKASVKVFEKCRELFPETKFIYNGDIDSYNSFIEKQEKISDQHHWMIGRGLLQKPWLAKQIKEQNDNDVPYLKVLYPFAVELCKQIENTSNDKGHAFNRAKIQMVMLFENNERTRKMAKLIKKSKKMEEVYGFLKMLPLSLI